jgi:hypothetical protein
MVGTSYIYPDIGAIILHIVTFHVVDNQVVNSHIVDMTNCQHAQ